MDWRTLAQALFPAGFDIREQDQVLSGSAVAGGQTITVVGTCGNVAIGVDTALAQARAILDTLREHPGRPILLLVDTQGQRLRHRDEMLGINRYMAHLAKCVDLARRRGHPTLALVYDQALSGGFVASGLMADACFALPTATLRVMALPAMARITGLALAQLEALAATHPVFAPGPDNFWRMGGLQAIWRGDLAQTLQAALQAQPSANDGPAMGAVRGGRTSAQAVITAILDGQTD